MRLLAVLGLLLVSLAGCGGSRPDPQTAGIYKLGGPYRINGRWYRPYYDPNYRADGVASWYGDGFHGRVTANGELFDKRGLTAAHPTLPLPSLVRVTNLENGRQTVVRVNDRGPFVGDRLIDVSQRTARELGFERKGLARVRVEFLQLAADGRGTPPEPDWGPPPRPEPRWQAVAGRTAGSPAATAASAAIASEPPPSSCVAEGAFIQVAAFTEPERAEALAMRLGDWRPARIVTHRANNGLALSRVQLGPFLGAEQVGGVLADLRGMGFQNAFLIAAGGAGAPSWPSSC